jgi:hypothetical protein
MAKVRRGKVHESERYDEPHHAREDEGDEALPVPDHAAERGRDQDECSDDPERGERNEEALTGSHAAGEQRGGDQGRRGPEEQDEGAG